MEDDKSREALERQVKQAEVAQRLCKRHEAAKSEQSAWVSLWQDLADYTRPNQDYIASEAQFDAPSLHKHNKLFDGTAVHSNMILAAGCMSWLTPAETPWFAFDPPHSLRGSEAVKSWLAQCTEVIRLEMATSNFYSEVHESYLDRGAFGTAAMWIEPGKDGAFNFDTWEIGKYSILENNEKRVDTVFREYTLTIRQAQQEFGFENLPKVVQDKIQDGEKWDQTDSYLHAIYPREDAERDLDSPLPEEMPIASVYMHLASKTIVKVSGFEEMPVVVSRFLKWGRSAYGYAPSWSALPDARQVNDLQKNLDVLAETAAFPRMLLPTDHEGEVDLRANGVTFFKDPARVPREWMTQGRYDIGKDRVMERQEAIKRAFHTELFQLFANLDKQMTAREVIERTQEKLVLFSPTFARLTTEFYNPILKRVFNIALRRGVIPPPPQEAIVEVAPGVGMIPDPQVSYNSRMALALKAIHNTAFMRTMESAVPLIQAGAGDVLDNFNLDAAMRDMSRNEGLPDDWIRPENEVRDLRETRAQAIQEQQQVDQMQQMADAANKAGLVEQGQ